MADCGSRGSARNWEDLECTKMHWRQSGTPEANAFVAKFSQATNSVGSILGVSKRAGGRSDQVWGWGVVISFRISEAVRCADRSRNAGRWPAFSVDGVGPTKHTKSHESRTGGLFTGGRRGYRGISRGWHGCTRIGCVTISDHQRNPRNGDSRGWRGQTRVKPS